MKFDKPGAYDDTGHISGVKGRSHTGTFGSERIVYLPQSRVAMGPEWLERCQRPPRPGWPLADAAAANPLSVTQTSSGIWFAAAPGAGYSITLSARCRSDGGIVRPSAFAVLRLMTRSNFVGCSTGRSAGLAPLRILST